VPLWASLETWLGETGSAGVFSSLNARMQYVQDHDELLKCWIKLCDEDRERLRWPAKPLKISPRDREHLDRSVAKILEGMVARDSN
jgi:hypothetical protein